MVIAVFSAIAVVTKIWFYIQKMSRLILNAAHFLRYIRLGILVVKGKDICQN